jgi:hypothetical protein
MQGTTLAMQACVSICLWQWWRLQQKLERRLHAEPPVLLCFAPAA